MSRLSEPYPLVRNYSITPLDSPIGTFLQDRLDWRVIQVSPKDIPDRKGSEVHRFGHWTIPNVYVRIIPPDTEDRSAEHERR